MDEETKRNDGIDIADRTPIITTTTINSTRLNPSLLFKNFLFNLAVKLRSNPPNCMLNITFKLCKKIVITKALVLFFISSALGSLSRRFESCRPDQF